MQFYVEKICLNFSIENTVDTFLYKVYFNFPQSKKEENFATEQIKSKKEDSSIKFNAILKCDYFFYMYQKIEINVEKLKKNSSLKNFCIGDNKISLSTIVTSKNGIFKTPISSNSKERLIIQVEKEKGKDIGINLNGISFLDYIKSGIQFKLFIAIDFSDKEYHILAEKKNPYLNSIKEFRKILYDFTKNYEVYGFGNNIQINNNQRQNFFNFNQDENFCELEGYTNIYLKYIENLNQIKFYDYLLKIKKLSPLLNYLINNKIMQQQNPNFYNIIFILINSLNDNEYQDCVDIFIQSSFLPLSFVVIGIGEDNNNFIKLKKLCEESKNSKGKKRIRNNAYFIEMKQCDECLKKIPEQLQEFFDINKVDLKQIIERNKIHIKNSLTMFDTYNSLISQINTEEKTINNITPYRKDKNIISNKNSDKNEIILDDKKIKENIDKNQEINKNQNNDIINIRISNKNKKDVKQGHKSVKKESAFKIYKKYGVFKTKEQKDKINNKDKTESNQSTSVGDKKFKTTY